MIDNFTDIDVDTLDFLRLNILNNLLVLIQEMNRDIEHCRGYTTTTKIV